MDWHPVQGNCFQSFNAKETGYKHRPGEPHWLWTEPTIQTHSPDDLDSLVLNCQKPVFSLGVSQQMHKITNP